MVSRTIFTSMTKGCFTLMLVLAALVIVQNSISGHISLHGKIAPK